MEYVALCHTCRVRHKIEFDHAKGPPPPHVFSDWYVKHPHPHLTEFRYPRRRQREMSSTPAHSWDGYLHNADIKIAYGGTTTPTMTLASLAASSTLLAGRESSAVDNGASVKYLDYLVAGNFKAAASNNQAGNVYVTVVGARDDTPTWPDVFDGTDSAETVSKQGVFDQICRMLANITADATASQTWYFGPCSLAQRYGGAVPDQFVYFVTHNIQTSTNGWSSTENDHAMRHTPVYATSV